MAEYQVKNLKMALSGGEEAAFNRMYGLEADRDPITVATGNASLNKGYHPFVTSSATFYVPTAEKFDDRGKVGLGQELPTSRSTGYLNPVTMEISNTLDTFIHPILLRRLCGTEDSTEGVVTGSAPNTAARTHTFKMAQAIDRPSSSSLLWALGALDYVWTGMTVNTFRVEGSRAAPPTFTATLVGTGGRESIAALKTENANTDIVTPMINDYVPPKYVIGAETEIFFTHPVHGAVPLAQRSSETQRITAWSVGVNNNNKTDDKRPGDPRLTVGLPTGGHYVNRITTGSREVTGEVTIALDENSVLREIQDSLADVVMTDFTISHRGEIITSGGNDTDGQYMVEFVFPKCYLNVTEAVDDDGLAVLRTELFPVFSDFENTSMIVNVRQGVNPIDATQTKIV